MERYWNENMECATKDERKRAKLQTFSDSEKGFTIMSPITVKEWKKQE